MNIKKLHIKLIDKKLTISVAESCTGGLLANNLTKLANSSKYFQMGLITYSNEAKIKILKVNRKIINKYGAVSKECCEVMVKNLSKISKSKINVSITGIAGPGGGTKDKPVGLFQFDSHTDTYDTYFGGFKYTHGTPFRRAIEENLIDPKKYVMLGIRGSLYHPDDVSWARDQGITVITIDDYYEMGFEKVIEKIYQVLHDVPTLSLIHI